MSRYSNSRRSSHDIQSSTVAINRMIAREGNYREAISKNQTFLKLVAESFLVKDGTTESVLLNAAVDGEKSTHELQELFQEQRQRLQQISHKNVENNRQVQAFVGALAQVHEQKIAHTALLGEEEANLPNYEKIITETMEEYRTNISASQLNMQDEQYCREIMTALGEQASKEIQEEDEDDLQVVGGGRGTSSEALKCPIMGTLIEEPLKSKLCGHVYSKAGIYQHLISSKKCPIAGCNNSQLTKQQLEPDHETEMKVRRQRRREEQERQHRATQDAFDIDDDDDEE